MRRRSLNVSSDTLTIVTGADESHAASLFQLLESVQVHEPRASIVVYDLGLSVGSLSRLEGISSGAFRVNRFEFERHPEYFDIRVNAGEYAWKPVIFAVELDRLETRFLVWLDAGNVLDSKLRKARRAIARYGLWSPASQGRVRDWTDVQLIDRLGLTRRQQARRNLNGAILGIDSRSSRARFLTQLWALGARSKEWIAPPGSSRKNHRQDQALLSSLAAATGLHPMPRRTREIRIHQDID